MIDLEKVSEGIDYKVYPREYGWYVEILRGVYKGYRIVFNEIQIDGISGTMSFKYLAVDPQEHEQRSKNIEDFAGDILEDIIKTQIANGGIEFYGKDSDN